MNRPLLSALVLWAACSSQRLDAVTPYDPTKGSGGGYFQMEALNRGVVAVKAKTGVYVGWRMFGTEYDPQTPENVSYNVYRDGGLIASVGSSSNYLDPAGTAGATYSVRAVIGGVEKEDSGGARVWAENFLRIPLTPPPPGVTPGQPTCETRVRATPTTPTTAPSAT